MKRIYSWLMMAMLALAGCQHGSRTIAPPPPSMLPSAAKGPEVSGPFEFHSGIWVNLHHRLYQEAVRQKAPDRGGARRGSGEVISARLSPDHRADWQAAVDYYAANIAGRDLLFDRGLVEVKYQLSLAERMADLRDSGVPRELAEVLEKVAPTYRAHAWPEDDRRNRAWIESAAALVARYGPTLMQEFAHAYRIEWPREPLRVDVTQYAGRFAAYTTLFPVHATISAADERNAGDTALEVVFHEASHGLVKQVSTALHQAFGEQGKQLPRDLWHAVIFFTVGELMQRTIPGYVPFANRVGGWQVFRGALEAHWRPYLERRETFETAVQRLAQAL